MKGYGTPSDDIDPDEVLEAYDRLKNALHYWDAPAGPTTKIAVEEAKETLARQLWPEDGDGD